MGGFCRNFTIVLNGDATVQQTDEAGEILNSMGGQTVDTTGDWTYRELSPLYLSKYDDLFRKAGKTLGFDWRLIAAHCYIESRWNPRATNYHSNALGMWQIIGKYWAGHAPKGYEDSSYAYTPSIATENYIGIMTAHLNRHKTAVTRKDQILLAIQCYHDGSVGNGTKDWANRIPGKYGKTDESIQYVPKIIKKYKEFCS